MADNFWLTDLQWAVIEPHLPMVHTGPVRQNDRRVLSGIIHRFREGCRCRRKVHHSAHKRIGAMIDDGIELPKLVEEFALR